MSPIADPASVARSRNAGVRVGGGPERLIDELRIAIAPVVPGQGESLFEGVDMREPGYECVEFAAPARIALRAAQEEVSAWPGSCSP